MVRGSRKKKLKTYMGFPVGSSHCSRKASSGMGKEWGVAIIIAVMVISMMFIFISDIIINSAVSIRMALATRDNIKAEYLAKSGKNIGILLLTGDLLFDMTLWQQTKKKPADGEQDFWALFNGMPIGGGTAKTVAMSVENFDLNKVNDQKVIDTLDMFDGEFTVNIVDEQKKININNCALGRGEECLPLLLALMSCPAEKEYLSRKKVTAEELAANIKDWVDQSASVTNGSTFSAEEDGYSERRPDVKPKNAPFDSMQEIKLVAGWDDDLYKIFSPYLTIYPIKKNKDDKNRINLNSSSLEMMSCLTKANEDNLRRAMLAYNPAPDEEKLQDVAGLKEVKKRLRVLFGSADKKLDKQFTYRSDVFRLNIKGEVGDQVRELEMVIQRGLPEKEDLKEDFKGSYKILYWKLGSGSGEAASEGGLADLF